MKTKIDRFFGWIQPILAFFPKILGGIKILLGVILSLWIGNIILEIIFAHIWILYVLDATFLVLLILFIHRNTHKDSKDIFIGLSLLIIGLIILFATITLFWNIFFCFGIWIIGSIYIKIEKRQRS